MSAPRPAGANPCYGARSVWTWVKLRGHVLPVTATDDQYKVRFPDGTEVWVEKHDCDSAFESDGYKRDKDALRTDHERRVRDGVAINKASSSADIDSAFERNEGKFVDG